MTTETAKPSIRPKLDKYQASITATGSKSKICGDDVSASLSGLTLDETLTVASAVTGTDAAELQGKYKHLNPGQQRMNLGNVVRGALRNKDEAKAAKAKATFDKLTAALRKVVDKRTKETANLKAEAKKAADKEKEEKAQAKQAEKAQKAADRKAKADAKPKAKPLPVKAPKEPAKPAVKAKPAAKPTAKAKADKKVAG